MSFSELIEPFEAEQLYTHYIGTKEGKKVWDNALKLCKTEEHDEGYELAVNLVLLNFYEWILNQLKDNEIAQGEKWIAEHDNYLADLIFDNLG